MRVRCVVGLLCALLAGCSDSGSYGSGGIGGAAGTGGVSGSGGAVVPVTRAELTLTLEHGKRTGDVLGRVLVASGIVSHDDVEALARDEIPSLDAPGGIGTSGLKYEGCELAVGRRPYVDDMMPEDGEGPVSVRVLRWMFVTGRHRDRLRSLAARVLGARS